MYFTRLRNVMCNVKGLWSAADGEFDFAKCLNLEEGDATAAAMTALADKLKSSECVCVCVCVHQLSVTGSMGCVGIEK